MNLKSVTKLELCRRWEW